MSISKLKESVEKGLKGLNVGLSMGLPKLESLICGINQSTYYLLGGMSSSGKTSALLYSFIYKPYTEGKKIKFIYYSLEMPEEILQAKLLALRVYEKFNVMLTTNKILSRGRERLNDEELKLIEDAYSWLENLMEHLLIYDRTLTANKMYAHVLTELKKYGTIKKSSTRVIYKKHDENLTILVILDHIGLLKVSTGNTKKTEIDLASSYLVTLRNIYTVSPVVLSQLNRQSSSMDRRKAGFQEIQVDDFKDTGNTIEDSDVTLALFNPYREKMAEYNNYNITILKDRFRSIVVLKNRYGECNKSIGLNFFGEIGYFIELPPGDKIVNQTEYANAPAMVKQENRLIENKKNKLQLTL